jgi:hypothetical protein
MNKRTGFSFLAFVLMLLSFACVGAAQNRQETLRTVHGVVLDKSDSPAASAVVFLKNTRNNDVRSYITNDAGEYRFSGLDPNADYEIHAEKDDAKSATRTISSFDSRKEIVLNLKLDKKKS